MTTPPPFLGIDFGTSKSCMAWVKPNGEAEVLRNAEGEDKTPSVVYFGDGDQVLVGSPAEDMLLDEAERPRVLTSVKRELANAATISLPGGKRVKPIEAAAAVLRKLRRDAEELHFHQPVGKAVITCPAGFDPLERDEIKKAGKFAGFEEVTLLEEPVAAGLAHRAAGQAMGKHVLVYDLGGGTFDLALLIEDPEKGYRSALSPQGIRRCGGDDFDLALYEHLDGVALQALGRPIAAGDKLDKGFLHECREAKERLTAREWTQVTYLPGEGWTTPFKHRLERGVFEDLVRERVAATVRLTETLVQEAATAKCPVDTVVLIGGSARVPLVTKQLQAALPVPPQRWEKQDLAVALGAAYHAAQLWGNAAAEKAAAERAAAERAAAKKLAAEKAAAEQAAARKLAAETAAAERAAAEKLAAEKAAAEQAAGAQGVRQPVSPAVTVAPDGSGDYSSLDKALANVPPGATIRLRPGEYRLAKRLIVEKALNLIGAGMDATKVVSEYEVVVVAGAGDLHAQGITFLHFGMRTADVMRVDAGRLELTECRLTGGAVYGSGLTISGTASAKVVRCHFHGNARQGITIENRAQTIVVGNTCRDNQQAGISVRGEAQPTLEGNLCQRNKLSGISYCDSASGVARQNLCEENGGGGILVEGQAHPTLEENTCQDNAYSGIECRGKSAGIVRRNRCLGNGTESGWLNRQVGGQDGIRVAEKASPLVERNVCNNNSGYGIWRGFSANPRLVENECTGNDKGAMG